MNEVPYLLNFHKLRQANSRLAKSQASSMSHVSNLPPAHGRGVLVTALKPATPTEVHRAFMQSLHANVQIQIDQDRILPHVYN